MSKREPNAVRARSGSFFTDGAAADPIYKRVRDGTNSRLCEARCFIEQMWAECSQFIDPDAPERAKRDYTSVFGELHFAYTLHSAGISLVARANRTPSRKGPDLQSENPPIWIEVVTPAAGEGPDGLIEPQPDKVQRVPTDAYLLRLLNSVAEKSKRFNAYRVQGTIPSTDATVIAISGARLPYRFNEGPIPWIVQAVLPVGDLNLEIARGKKKAIPHSVEFSNSVAKKSGAPVPTDVFLKSNYAHVSAILYSPADCVNHPAAPDPDLILVHHANPTTRIHRGWLPFGREYWIGDDSLRWTDHT